MTQENIISSFRCTGICPFNKDAMQLPIGNVLEHAFLEEKTCSSSFLRIRTVDANTGLDTDHPGCEDISPTLPYLQRQTSLTRTLLRLDAVPPQLKIPEARLNSCGQWCSWHADDTWSQLMGVAYC